MIKHTSKFWGCLGMSLFAAQVFAADTIKVTVKTTEKNAIAIGFTVDHKEYGTLGKSYTGRGPKDKVYYFGFRKDSILGENVSCGSLTLTQPSTVVLMMQENKCYCALG
ncbi:hypothetical protein [Legionella worsleiensis]|uniref:Secreted protein n=1 Tax=Legionella worsleiensis TaxID=45076 RepID=A0A0W1A637_9GAMM|nr:hypothetical protein [Legionella worsleiensis]KTD76805.1 hypothetical protein Lwor_2030 [Legionella worsleiensis]STY30651.1 Uncharacterised protein [Legionella worsleiensis]